jgi:hypothetical protein
MATSIKLSELKRLNQASLTDTDLFLVTDQETNASMALSYKVLREKLLTSLQETVTALQADVDSNETEVYEVIAQLQEDVDANEVASFNARSTETLNREQAVAALQALIDSLSTEASSRLTRIEALEADPTTKTYVDEQIASLIDGAPGVLDTLNELSEALGGDSNLAATLSNSISTLQASLDALSLVVDEKASSEALTAEVTRATDAEAALQTSIDTLSAQSQATDTSLTAQINAEVSRATGVEGTLRTDLDAEITARTSGNTDLDTRLTSLEGVVDGLDIDLSPDTLNSIKELADSLGGDDDFVSTINNLVAEETAARIEADSRQEQANLEHILAFGGDLTVLDLSVG